MNRKVMPEDTQRLVQDAVRKFKDGAGEGATPKGEPFIGRSNLQSGATRHYACISTQGKTSTIGVQTRGDKEAGVFQYNQREIIHWAKEDGDQIAWAERELQRHVEEILRDAGEGK